MNNNFLQPFLHKGKALFLAYDHGLEHGPKDLIGQSINPEYILDLAVKGRYTGIILQKGIAEKYYTGTKYQKTVPLILKINGKTNIPQIADPYSPINCSVEYAKKLGAKAVGYTIYLGSKQEERMFADFGKIQEQAHQLKMAAIAWVYPYTKRGQVAEGDKIDKASPHYGVGVYPRGSAVESEVSPEITAYAARVGLELGADMIKIKYSGSEETFKKAVQLAGKTKVVLSGGSKTGEEEFLNIVESVIKAGATGIAVGRNVFQHQDPLAMTKKIKEIVFG